MLNATLEAQTPGVAEIVNSEISQAQKIDFSDYLTWCAANGRTPARFSTFIEMFKLDPEPVAEVVDSLGVHLLDYDLDQTVKLPAGTKLYAKLARNQGECAQ